MYRANGEGTDTTDRNDAFMMMDDFWDPDSYLRRLGQQAQSSGAPPVSVGSGGPASTIPQLVQAMGQKAAGGSTDSGGDTGGPFHQQSDVTSALGYNPWGNFDVGDYGGPSSPTYHFTNAPSFKAPPNFVPPNFDKWLPPSSDAILASDPGYNFRLQQGMDTLQNSAAAKGILQTGGTLKDLQNYGQNFASQEYGNVFNRALQSYEEQYKGALDAYNTRYTAAKDMFSPQFTSWQTLTQAEEARALAEFQRSWDVYSLGVAAKLAKEGYITSIGLGGNQQMPPPKPPGA